MKDYLRFRKFLDISGLGYNFDDETELYHVYDWHGLNRNYFVSVPDRIARYDFAVARDLVDTARSFHTLFGS